MMNLRSLTFALVAIALLSAVTSPALAKGRGVREKVEWANLPPSVRVTIESNAKGGKIIAIEKRSRRGEVTYSAEVEAGKNKVLEIEVDPDGKLLGVEEGEPD